MNRNENEAESFAGNFVASSEEGLFFEVPISCTLSDYAGVNFGHDVVEVRITPSLGLRLRQHTASLDLEPGDIGQLGDGTKDARPIFGRKLLRQGCFDLQERHGRGQHRGQQQVADASHYVVHLISMIWPGAGLS
jgi:hypothetical protein